MRIGEVSRRYNISIDNIYFYIRYGLIVPPKPTGQYDFDRGTLSDLELVLELKELDLSLKEIHGILSLIRVSNLADRQDIEDVKKIYAAKQKELAREKERLTLAEKSLSDKIAALDMHLTDSFPQIGLPLRMLHLLACPLCRSELVLNNVHMNQRYIFNGDLNCHCGYHARIKDGIVLTPNKNSSKYDKPDVTRELYKDLPPHLISLFQRSYNWLKEQINGMDLSNKVIMETYINAWFFLHNHQDLLPKSSMLIVTDKFHETLQMYKELIERQNYGIDILYIADSGVKLPLKHSIVDLNIDFFAVNEHNFYHKSFWLELIGPYLKSDADALGVYFHFENGRRSMQNLISEYPETYFNNFNKKYFIESVSDAGYQFIEKADIGYSTDSGENLGFSFHSKGEKMHLMPYRLKAPKYS